MSNAGLTRIMLVALLLHCVALGSKVEANNQGQALVRGPNFAAMLSAYNAVVAVYPKTVHRKYDYYDFEVSESPNAFQVTLVPSVKANNPVTLDANWQCTVEKGTYSATCRHL